MLPVDAVPAESDLGADRLTDAVVAVAVLSRSLERALSDLTLPQYRILALIESEPQRAARLATRSEVTKASLTSITVVLERRGLIQRDKVLGDRRGVMFGLTDEGREVLAASRQVLNDRLRAFLARFAADEREAVLHGLQLIVDSTGKGYSAPGTHAAMKARGLA
ncbi:MarR family transcriptional regulator [Kineosporia sp. J2-2]|uniref:MarR family transcriptional regulator n=1 Tax=Kineosporia corallincola TaxID=2835133 RepID=A0ABS5TK97_9ACTN|nr:MarR family transcriptional regulator [Kineosporia corallincola]MBT0771515.1 MarR family transcriptional regulator [Kineosporia corallincola]